MEGRLKTFEEKLKKSHQNDEATFRLLKEQTQKLLESVEAQKADKDELAAKRKKELKALEQAVLGEIGTQSENYFEAGSKVHADFDDKSAHLRNELLADKKEREANTSALVASVSDEISLIQGELFAERKNREEAYDKIIKKLGLEVLRLNDTLNQEKKVREETHNQLRSMLAGMKIRLSGAAEVPLTHPGRAPQQTREPRLPLQAARRNRLQSVS